MNLTGKILISTAAMDDPLFRETAVFITEHNKNGATGFIINKLFELPLNALTEFSKSPAFPLYNGGPVDQEHLFFIHRRPDLIPGGILINEDIFFSGDFKTAITHINNHKLTQADIKIFIGYCGWNAGEPETEIAEGSWRIKESSSQIVFSGDPMLFLVN